MRLRFIGKRFKDGFSTTIDITIENEAILTVLLEKGIGPKIAETIELNRTDLDQVTFQGVMKI